MARSVGRWTRLGVGLQVVVAAVLAVGAAVLLVDLSDWKYARWDLSASGRNTLDESLLELVRNLPEEAKIDVFFRPLERPYDGVSRLAQARVTEMLFVLKQAERDRIDIEMHDVRDLAATQARLRELGVEQLNVLVVSCGERRATLALFRDLVEVDWGNPNAELYRYLYQQGIVVSADFSRPPSRPGQELRRFRAGDALAEALLKVSSARAPRIYFAVGHGEPNLEQTAPTEVNDLGRLRLALLQDGFQVEEWDASADGDVPVDCEVLVMVGASQPYQAADLARVRAYVERGGRLIAAPSFEDFDAEVSDSGGGAPGSGLPEGIAGFLRTFGMLPQPGVVCVPLEDQFGREYDRYESCAEFEVGETGLNRSHAVTIPLRQNDRRVQFAQTFSFGRGGLERGSLEDLISSDVNAWRDVRDPMKVGRLRDWTYERTREERGRWSLCKVAYLHGGATGPGQEGRILGVAGGSFFGNLLFTSNRDFILNAFNWMADRDHRVQVRVREVEPVVLDVARGGGLSVLTYVLWLVLPGMCIAMGFFVTWRRRR